MERISTLLQEYRLAHVKATNKNGDTILHLAIENNRHMPKNIIEILPFLLNDGFDVNIKNQKQETILHLALKYKLKDVINVLLTYNHKFKSTTNREDPVIKCLLEVECYKMSELKKQSKICENKKIEKEYKSNKFVEWILSEGFEIRDSTVYMALWQNLFHILPALLKYMPVNNNRKVIKNMLDQLIMSVKSSNNFWYSGYIARNIAKVVKALADKGLFSDNFEAEEQTIVLQAINSEGHIKIIKALIEYLKNVNFENDQGETLFQITFHKWLESEKLQMEYYTKILRALIDKGANINQPNTHEYIKTPLISAVQRRNLRAIEFLRDNGAHFTITSVDSDTLLHILLYSVKIGKSYEKMDIALIDMFIENGCQVNAKNSTGLTPLIIAIEKGYMTIIRKLIESGAHINCRSNQNLTPLHYACKYVRPDVAELLLELGANVNATDDNGNTPLNQVIRNIMIGYVNRSHIILLEYGAELNKDFSFISDFRLPQVTNNTGFGYDRKIEMHKKFGDLVKHWIKLLVAKLKYPANSEYENLIMCVKDRKVYFNCLSETEILKSTFVDKFERVSLYNFLHMDPSKRRLYMNSENLKSLINDQKMLENKFPNYSVLIKAFYREAVTWKRLLESAKEAWLDLTGITLPDICLEYMFSFLSNSDLFNIIGEN